QDHKRHPAPAVVAYLQLDLGFSGHKLSCQLVRSHLDDSRKNRSKSSASRRSADLQSVSGVVIPLNTMNCDCSSHIGKWVWIWGTGSLSSAQVGLSSVRAT